MNYESWSSQVKNHATTKARIDKYIEIYGNKTKKQQKSSTSAIDTLANAALSEQPSVRKTYTRSKRTAFNSVIEALENQARINGWLENSAPFFPVSVQVLSKYVDFMLSRVKKGTIGYTRIQGLFPLH